jgi:DNA-binding LacI/PurR family transcriptional regulator
VHTSPETPSPHPPLEFGLVLRRPPRLLGIDPFYAEFIAGMENVLADYDGSVLLEVVPSLARERESYERWAAAGTITGVVLADLVEGDERAVFLQSLGIATIVLGETEPPPGVAAVQVDNYAAMNEAVVRLAGLGHRVIGRVSGPPGLLHTVARTQSFDAAIDAAGVAGFVAEGDYTEAGGDAGTRELLALTEPPTAIIYDDDVMAVAGLEVASELGIDVPAALSLLAWDDSALCRLAVPPLSVMGRDVRVLGEIAARSLIAVLMGEGSSIVAAPAPRFIARGSTAIAPRRATQAAE